MEFYKETKFKNTEIGRIPNDWDVKEVKSIGQVITGTTPRTKVKEYWNGAYPFVTPTDISETKYVYKTERTVSNKGVEVGRIVPKDTVLVTCIASIGKMALAFKECITNQQINSIICNNKIDPHYIYYIIKNREDELKHSAGKTTNAIVKKSLFEKFLLPLPCTYDEQRRISTILSSIDCLIQQTNSIIQKTQELKKGLMQELLTKGIGHKEFKYSEELGCEIPKEWRTLKIKAIGELVNGFGFPIKYQGKKEGKYIFAKVSDTNLAENDKYINTTNNFIDDDLAKRMKVTIYPKGTIIFPKIGMVIYLRKVRILAREGTFDNNIMGIIPNRNVTETEFLYYYFLEIIDLTKLTITTTAPSIRKSDVEELSVACPPIHEQRQIVSIILNIDDQIDKERNTKEELVNLKKGLMQILLTGQVRIKVN